MRLLARREHSREELRRKLGKSACAPDDVVRVLDECAAAGWQSDDRYAEEFARRRAERGFGPLRIRYELEQGGVAAATVATALTGLEETWAERLRGLIEKRCQGSTALEPEQRARLMRFLQGRGYTGEQIRSALQTRDAS